MVQESYTKVALQYGLVILVMAYLHAIQVPQLIQVFIDKHQHPELSQAVAVKPLAPAWDDKAFMATYVCNPSHSYWLETVHDDPHLRIIKNFLAPGEADHLVAVG